MKKIVSIKEERIRRGQDTMLDLVMSDPGLIARRKAARDAYWAEVERQSHAAEAARVRAAEADLLAAKAAVGAMVIGVVATLIGLA